MDFGSLDIFLSGSAAERFCVPMTEQAKAKNSLFVEMRPLFSDLDYMLIPNGVEASFRENEKRFHIQLKNDEKYPILPC